MLAIDVPHVAVVDARSFWRAEQHAEYFRCPIRGEPCLTWTLLVHGHRGQAAKWLTRERIPAQRDGRWAAQSVKNLVVRYRRLTGERLLISYKRFPQPAHRYRRP
jgi:hypothetical protein